jgi:hypothetical protein
VQGLNPTGRAALNEGADSRKTVPVPPFHRSGCFNDYSS